MLPRWSNLSNHSNEIRSPERGNGSEMHSALDGLRGNIQNAQWFSRLGTFSSQGRFIAITDHDAWVEFTSQCVAEQHGLEYAGTIVNDQLRILDAMDWLPTSQTESNPFDDNELINFIKNEGKLDLLKRVRLDLCEEALASLQNPESKWMTVGPTDYSEAARQGVLFAIRMACVEAIAQRVDVWCSCCDLYAVGHWPIGKLQTGEIVVI